MFRGVESDPNFFIGSLRAIKEIPALKSFEMPIAAEREFFSVTTPLQSAFWGISGESNLFVIFL